MLDEEAAINRIVSKLDKGPKLDSPYDAHVKDIHSMDALPEAPKDA